MITYYIKYRVTRPGAGDIVFSPHTILELRYQAIASQSSQCSVHTLGHRRLCQRRASRAARPGRAPSAARSRPRAARSAPWHGRCTPRRRTRTPRRHTSTHDATGGYSCDARLCYTRQLLGNLRQLFQSRTRAKLKRRAGYAGYLPSVACGVPSREWVAR
jgi:hypothetical protein